MVNHSESPNFETVSKLCCCLKLTTGMTILAWIQLIVSVLACGCALFQIIAVAVGFESAVVDITIEGLDAMTANIILLIAYIIYAYVCYLFIQAIKTENPSGVLPYLVLNGIYLVFVMFIAISTLSFYLFFVMAAYIYIYICTYSLYKIFSYTHELLNPV